MTTKTPYWLTEDEKPEQALYADLKAGIRDLYDRVTVHVAGSSNAEYDGAWVGIEGEFHVEPDSVRMHSAGSPEFDIKPTYLAKGYAMANMSKAELIRLRNAIDMLVETMEYKL